MPDISIIIPIYNSAIPALQRCLDSASSIPQLHTEIILVDDGSQPYIETFCKDFVEQHPNFHYYRKENGGVSSARNFGLTQATGTYIMFLDDDDVLLGENICPGAIVDTPDLVIFDIILHENGSERIWKSLPSDAGTVNREPLLFQLLTQKSLNSPCVKLFRRDIIQDRNIHFDSAFITGEDWMFVCDFALSTTSVYYAGTPCYRYFRDAATGQSRMARFPDQMLQNQFDRFARKLQIVAQETWSDYKPAQILSLAATELIENLFNSASDLLLAKKWTKERKQLLRQAVSRAGKLLCPCAPKKTRLKLWVLNYCPIMLRPLALMRALYLKRKH